MRHPKKFREYVECLVGYFQTKMLLSDYTVSVVFSEVPDKTDTNNSVSHAEIDITEEYLRTELTIYPESVRAWRRKDYRVLADTVCHELSHIITWPIYNRIPDNMVTVEINKEADQKTQRIANIVMSHVSDDEILPSSFGIT